MVFPKTKSTSESIVIFSYALKIHDFPKRICSWLKKALKKLSVGGSK
jgi:hypothetical protein